MQVTQPAAARRSAQLFLAYAIGCVGLWLINTLVFRLVPSTSINRAVAVLDLGWLGLTAVLVVGALLLAGAVDRPGRAWALAGLATVTSGLWLMARVLHWTELDLRLPLGALPALELIELGFGLTERALFYWLLVDLSGASRRSWSRPLAGVGMGLALARGMIELGLTAGPSLGLDLIAVLSSAWYPLAQAAIGVGGLAVLLALTLGAFAGVKAAAPSGVVPASAPRAVSSDFLIGGLLLTIGLVVSVGSFVAASSGGGGRYIVATGAIAVGIGRLIRGAIRSSREVGTSDGA